ncbi:uncharacterized protein KY384_009019 [Bacidia gigantensis]|uniref:uncharacterized protein n=1 Tax=Bacidia gigantensis TaxID=2732470 RepID=UPI001D0451D4|nr:uncharacterized protein KY384_009019 [Bacidia gigantensis]KAG8525375.1 hypothetical protein KY384_009019 [Bacidia gigantensis]
MRLPRLSPNGSLLSFTILLLLISHIAAQGLPKLPSSDDDSDSSTTDSAAAPTSDSKETDSASATASATDKTQSKTSDMPGLSGLPKLKGDDYPPPSVPPTADAPFMQKSNLPEGTVFICVGAALGFIGFMLLAWRGFLAWSVHRSVRRAAMAQVAKHDGKDPLRGLKTKGPYVSTGPGSTLSLDQLAGGKGGDKVNSTRNSLFFSPTAGAGMQSPANRGSGYLPSGYYAAGNAAPANGASLAHIGAGVPMSNLGNQNRRYSRASLRANSAHKAWSDKQVTTA